MPRVVLVTGKGGVGKTTTAAATAVHAARSGLRTLVMSTDAAHSLGDALDVDLRAAQTWRDTHEVEPACTRSPSARTPASRPTGRSCATTSSGVLDAMGVDAVVADELTALPGVEEVAALAALAHQADSGDWDVVVVDCAPTAETLRLLALPEVLGWHLDRLLPAQRRLLTVLRPAATAATGIPTPGPEVLGTVRAWRELMVGVRALLTSPRASVRVVLTPERVVIAESRRVLTSLSLHGYAVDAVVVNRLLPAPRPGDTDEWRDGVDERAGRRAGAGAGVLRRHPAAARAVPRGRADRPRRAHRPRRRHAPPTGPPPRRCSTTSTCHGCGSRPTGTSSCSPCRCRS